MATAPPTVTYTSVAEVCTHLRNGARRLLRKVPELELAAQNGIQRFKYIQTVIIRENII